jgi:hypothetical protein
MAIDFDRNTHYATYIRNILAPSPETTAHTLQPSFSNHVNFITSVLVTHLSPIFTMRPAGPSDIPLAQLKDIVTHAGLLRLSMRLDAHTVHYFEPVFKEDTFNGKRMECYNHKSMRHTNSRTPDDDEPLLPDGEKYRRTTIPEAEKKHSKNDDPLTQITIMDGVTAYRLGGWEAPTSSLKNMQFEKFEYGDMGVRSRLITYGWVYCRWGRARKSKDGEAADVPEAHGTAWKGGFKEFTDVEGVVDWLVLEREERIRQRKKWVEEASKKANAKDKGKGRAVKVEVEEVETRATERRTSCRRRVDSVTGPSGSSAARVSDEEDVEAQLWRESGL